MYIVLTYEYILNLSTKPFSMPATIVNWGGGRAQTISQQYVSHAPYNEDSNAIEIALKVDYFKVKSWSFLVQTCRQV